MDSSWLGGSSTRPGFALVPPGSVMVANIPPRSTNTPTITYLSIPSGWGVDRQGSWPVLLSGDYSMTERRPHGWALALKTYRPDTPLIHQVASPARRSGPALSGFPSLINYTFVCTKICYTFREKAPSPIKGYRQECTYTVDDIWTRGETTPSFDGLELLWSWFWSYQDASRTGHWPIKAHTSVSHSYSWCEESPINQMSMWVWPIWGALDCNWCCMNKVELKDRPWSKDLNKSKVSTDTHLWDISQLVSDQLITRLYVLG